MLALLIVSLSAMSLWHGYFDEAYAREDARPIVAYIDSADDPATVVVVVSYPWGINHYYRGPLPVVGLRIVGTDGHGRLLVDETLDARVREAAAPFRRLLYVDLRSRHFDPTHALERSLNRLFRRIDMKNSHGIRAILYDTAPKQEARSAPPHHKRPVLPACAPKIESPAAGSPQRSLRVTA
ncbi:MAG: hypothetical protein D6815_02055 [Candidatus Dadabacteria bacterium]|nr:MAG: hypothetical protein D6815_02055 [Candidatus Dadabacteria bacterium]